MGSRASAFSCRHSPCFTLMFTLTITFFNSKVFFPCWSLPGTYDPRAMFTTDTYRVQGFSTSINTPCYPTPLHTSWSMSEVLATHFNLIAC